MIDSQDITRFEYLPNEILYQCFGYFNAFQLFYSFDRLNTRFDTLIRRLRLSIQFDRINKSVFNQFCSKLSFEPELKNQIYLIQLSNSYEYYQCQKFFSYFSFEQFPCLQKFQLLPSSSTWSQCEIIFSKLQILSIERLDQFHFNTHNNQTSSIINLTLAQCTFKDYFNIIKYLPLLKHFSIDIFHRYHDDDSEMKIQITTAYNLKQLIIYDFRNDFSTLEFLLRQTSILTNFTFCSTYSEQFLDAHRWQSLINDSLPYLNKFQFIFKCFFSENNQHRMIDIYQQFQSHFWQQQHHWSTQYTFHNYHFTIYTLPYLSKFYQFNSNHQTNFINIKQLTIDAALIHEHSQSFFPNITSLKIYGTDSHKSLTKMLDFSKLKSLDISQTILFEQDLHIFEKAIHLISLTISDENLSNYYQQTHLCTYFNQMIKKLYITNSITSQSKNFLQDKRFYETFAHIEHLNCSITSQNDLFMLTKSLPNLITCELLWSDKDNFQSKFSQFEIYAYEQEIDFHSKIDLNRSLDRSTFSCNIFLWLGNRTTNQ